MGVAEQVLLIAGGWEEAEEAEGAALWEEGGVEGDMKLDPPATEKKL